MSDKRTTKHLQMKELLTSIVGDLSGKEELEALTRDLIKTVVETALNGELEEHLGYKKHERGKVDNSRNGYYQKKLKSSSGEVEISVPRDRNSDYQPQFIGKGESRITGFEDKILSCYARGMSTRDIGETFEEMFGAKISATVISQVTSSVLERVKEWQNRVLDEVYPIVYLDCIQVKIREDNRVINKSIYLALGVNLDGHKELLGMWVSENEGAKFWLSVLTELSNRGVKDILIACVDGLTGFPDAIASIFPKTTIQLCIVHMIRNSLRYVSWKDRKALAAALRKVYTAVTADEARSELEKLKSEWHSKYPSVYKSWDSRWENVIPFFDFPESIRKVIYTTNAIESLNSVIRKAIKNRKIFPNDNSAFKTIFLATQNAAKKWTMPVRDWGMAIQLFSVAFDDRVKLN
jgi:transposase-like protein